MTEFQLEQNCSTKCTPNHFIFLDMYHPIKIRWRHQSMVLNVHLFPVSHQTCFAIPKTHRNGTRTSSIVTLQTVGSYKTSLHFYQTTQCHISKNSILCSHHTQVTSQHFFTMFIGPCIIL